MTLHPELQRITDRIVQRSQKTRTAYLHRIAQAGQTGPFRQGLSCSNLAHGFAACQPTEKQRLRGRSSVNVAIISAYNDMLSAHQPLEVFPQIIKDEIAANAGVAQFAGGVPAMCDGVTQGQPGMELSLFSRETIAMSTAIALSHNMFDAALCLGVCDKIVPGLLIGALSFGHLPVIFVPAGPMSSGLPNKEKARIRQLYAKGEIGREELLEAESASYHGRGTCTFYGTANSNQLLMEFMGLHLPGASFVHPDSPLRESLTRAASRRALQITALGNEYTPVGEVIDERAIVNALVGLLTSGGSTNHTIHLIAIARAAGVLINWDDFADLSRVIPLLARVYPNGMADVNHFHAAGGIGLMIRELLDAGLLHGDTHTIHSDQGLRDYTQEAFLKDDKVVWREGAQVSGDHHVLATVAKPFQQTGGLSLLKGNLGRAVIKTSAVKPEHLRIEAPALVFESQAAFQEAFTQEKLQRDFIAVVRFQGPSANGMPELHKLTPPLGVLQDQGYQVALVTDGRMSGASGKVPAAIHLTPESRHNGPLARVRDGDIIRLDALAGELTVLIDEGEWNSRKPAQGQQADNQFGMGRELFSSFRAQVSSAETGATVFGESTNNPTHS